MCIVMRYVRFYYTTFNKDQKRVAKERASINYSLIYFNFMNKIHNNSVN